MEHAVSLLPAMWFVLLGLILLLYTALDGFDLGVGIVSLFVRDERKRGILMGSLGSIWDANETWLVLFGGIIFGAFPSVYGLVLSSLYLPLVGMLVGLIFRAVSFEFRVHARSKRTWSLAFGWGSLLAAACQGFAFGGVLWGIPITHGRFTAGVLNWLTPFSVALGAAAVGGYVLIGSTYIIMKTEGSLARQARTTALAGAAVAVVAAIVVTALAVARYPFLRERWFAFPGAFITIVPMALALAAFAATILGIVRGRERLPFFGALAFALFGYAALSANYFPIIVPPSLTVYQAAAQPEILRVMLLSIAVAIPVLLAYNIYQYWVFRGKVRKNIYDEE